MTEPIQAILYAALCGGILCGIAQALIDLTALTPARIMVLYTVLGVLLSAFGLYDPLLSVFGEGIALPICGFGATLAGGVRQAIDGMGPIGILTGGLTATAGGITLTVCLGILISFIVKGRPKRM